MFFFLLFSVIRILLSGFNLGLKKKENEKKQIKRIREIEININLRRSALQKHVVLVSIHFTINYEKMCYLKLNIKKGKISE